MAVVISFVMAEIFPALSPAMMAAASITAINVSIFWSFRSSFDRIMANITSIIIAYILQVVGQVNPFGVAVGMLSMVIICSIFNWRYYIGSATIFFVFILEVPYLASQNYEVYSINRIFDTIIGTLIGLVINTFIFRPRQEKYLLTIYRKSYVNLRKEFKALLTEDKSVNEFKLIDDIATINECYNNLRNDIKLKMNSNVNTVTVSKLNNLFRMALSLIIELNDIEEQPKISESNNELLLAFFKGDYKSNHETMSEFDADNEYYNRYNYEIKKIIHTLESIEYNIYEFTRMYEQLENSWFKEGK